MNAISRGLMLIDIGHYESEIFFSHILKDELENLEVSRYNLRTKKSI